MELINSLFSDHLMHAIGWTIVHSLWQASFVALVMSIYLNRYQKEKSIVRYRIALSSLYILLGLSIITFCVYYLNPTEPGKVLGHSTSAIDNSKLSGSYYIQNFTFNLVHHFDFITSLWITGMIVFALKFIGGYALVKRYELSGEFIQESKVHVILNDLLDKMNLDKSVQVLESAKVYTPMMLGHFKPIILLPMGILNQLELYEVEAILAHELSHISRNDFLQNILQSFIEIVYYYHPAVWWISANVRAERENCCDEQAVKLCGSAVNYAKALVKIEEMQNTAIPSLAIPMARSKNNLINRVGRILNQPQNKSQIKEKMVATLLLFSVFTVFGESNHSDIELENTPNKVTIYTSDTGFFNVTVKEEQKHIAKDEKVKSEENLVRALVIDSEDSHLVIDTLPTEDCNCDDVSIESRSDDKSFKLKIDNGIVREFKINGKEVDNTNKYFKVGKHGSVIKTEDGSILLKEFDTKSNLGSNNEFRTYDYEKLEEDEILIAPFKIVDNGIPPTKNHENNLKQVLEEISESHHITTEKINLLKSWNWSSKPLEKNLKLSIRELLESLSLNEADQVELAFDGSKG